MLVSPPEAVACHQHCQTPNRSPHARLIYLLPHMPLILRIHLHVDAVVLCCKLPHRVGPQNTAAQGATTERHASISQKPKAQSNAANAQLTHNVHLSCLLRQCRGQKCRQGNPPDGSCGWLKHPCQNADDLVQAQVRMEVHHNQRSWRHVQRVGLRACKAPGRTGRQAQAGGRSGMQAGADVERLRKCDHMSQQSIATWHHTQRSGSSQAPRSSGTHPQCLGALACTPLAVAARAHRRGLAPHIVAVPAPAVVIMQRCI